jgi:hypothetical protein
MQSQWPSGFVAAFLILCFVAFTARASFVYETATEFIASGDFNADGIPDVMVLDKSTGNVRVGYQSVSNVLSWSPSLFTGTELVSGCGVGRFLQPGQDTIAITSPTLNGILLQDVSQTNSISSPYLVTPFGIGPHALAGFSNPAAGFDSLFAASAFNNSPAEQVEADFFFTGPLLSYSGLYGETGTFERPNGVVTDTNTMSLVAGIARNTNGDALHLWQFTNQASVVATLSNLSSGSEYAVGTFNYEPLPRFWVYVSGQTNISIYSLETNGTGVDFTSATILTVAQPIQHVFVLSRTNDDTAMIQFGDGVQGARLPGGVPTLGPKYSTGGGASGNVTGLVPLNGGNFVLLTAPTGAASSFSAQVMNYDGANFTLLSSNNLPALTTSSNRADVWLFQTEPFVNSDPGFISSLNAPDWSGNLSGLPSSILVRVETDSGTATGLSNPTTNNLGAPPAGTAFGLPDQYRDDVSLFSYTAPHPAQFVDTTISPAPGIYDGPITVSFTKQHVSDTIFYRLDTAAWQTYSASFSLTHNATVQYYARAAGGVLAARSPLHSAQYTLGNTGETPHDPILLTNSVFTNPPPVINTNVLSITGAGTVFYSRRSTNNNLTTIWTINLDGSGETLVTIGMRPRVSPDQHWMAFIRENDPATNQYSLWVRDLTTGQETRLQSSSVPYISHDWTRDSASLVFNNNCFAWRIGLTGPATQLPLASNCAQSGPSISPLDGSIAFQIIYPGSTGIYIAPPDASSEQKLTLSILSPRWPAWSPDGLRLAIVDDPTISAAINAGYNVWLLDGPGHTNTHQISSWTGNSAFPYGVIWKPDSTGLVGAGRINGTNGLWIIPLAPDGSACHCPPILLPTSPGDPIEFAGSIAVAPQVAIPTPGLFIRKETNAIVVYWSTNYDGFILQYATTLSPNSTWTEIDGPYFLANGYYEYHEAKSALAQTKVFRLSYPGVFFLTPPTAPLSLGVDSNQAVLNWPSDYVGYTLESTTNLRPPIVWNPVIGSYSVTNGQFEFRQDLNSGKQREFFRLRWP